jgi:phosphatidylinositol 4-kinase
LEAWQASAAHPVVADVAAARVLKSKDHAPFLVPLCASGNPATRVSLIVKADDEAHVEALAAQTLRWMNSVWSRAGIRAAKGSRSALHACAYDVAVIALGDLGEKTQHGLFVEVVEGARTIHELKSQVFRDVMAQRLTADGRKPKPLSSADEAAGWRQWLIDNVASIPERRERFLSTFCAATAASYVLQLKDRHNANVLLHEADGSWINIDYAFSFGRAPGGVFSLETSPARIPDEVYEVFLEGSKASKPYRAFAKSFCAALSALRAHADELTALNHALPPSSRTAVVAACGATYVSEMRRRLLLPPIHGSATKCFSPTECLARWESVLGDCIRAKGTRLYDAFQRTTNDIV